MSDKLYWLVKPEYYNNINEFLGSNFSNSQIKLFTNEYICGIYISYDDNKPENQKWGFMPYPHYSDYSDHSILKESKDWLIKKNYIYKGDISRTIKLKRLNDIQRKDTGGRNA